MTDLPLESEVEDAFFQKLVANKSVINAWRQVELPIGTADIMFVSMWGPNHKQLTVVEIKRDRVGGKAHSQLMGYIAQLKLRLLEELDDIDLWREMPFGEAIGGLLIGRSMSPLVARSVMYDEELGFTKYDVTFLNEIVFPAGALEGHNSSYDSKKYDDRISGTLTDLVFEYRYRRAKGKEEYLERGIEVGKRLSEYQELPY